MKAPKAMAEMSGRQLFTCFSVQKTWQLVLFLRVSVTNFVLFPCIVFFVVLMKFLMQTYCNEILVLSTNIKTNLLE